MKTLQQHISEKLVINKDFKKANLFKSEPLHDKGYCIYLALPINSNNYDIISIPDKPCGYETIFSNGKSSIYYNDSYEIKKNDYGFYFLDVQSEEWCWLILFEEEAISFLENLIQNIRQKIDITDCKDDNINIKTGRYICAHIGDFFYDKETIIYMINELKKSI